MRCRVFSVFVAMVLTTLTPNAWSVTGPTGWLTIIDIRTYDNGLLVRVAQSVNSACGYPDHLQVYTNNPNYQASLALHDCVGAR
jgi:hypothetical protein